MSNEINLQDKITRNLQALAEKRREILSLPPERALNLLLDEPMPVSLIHSFPEQDFYFLIHDIGVADCMELLSLASNRQWEYILDAEVWKRDRIDMKELTRWFGLLMLADPERLIRWAPYEQSELTEYYLAQNVELAVREHDQDPSDLGEGFLTEDDIFYIRLRDDRWFDPKTDTGLKNDRDEFLWDFLKRIALDDHILYQQILLESASIIPAEAEESACRLRNMRLAEKGYLPFEEAVGIYQPLSPGKLRHHLRKKIFTPPSPDQRMPVPLYPSGMLEPDNLFAHALARIDGTDIIESLQTEFAGLCNQVISADQRTIREREELREVVKKVCGYVSIGLQSMSTDDTPDMAAHNSALIRNHLLADIFRVGYGQALNLKWRADKWWRTSWAESRGFSLSFWDEGWLGVIGGLLVKKPLFYDNYRSGVLYREFRTLEDIEETRTVLENIMNMDRIFSRLDISLAPLPGGRLLTWKNLLLTLWTRHSIGLPPEIAPVALQDFRPFYRNLWDDSPVRRKTADSVKSAFLGWLSEQTGLPDHEISETCGHILENLFQEIESEYGPVTEEKLDPRYIHLFLLA